VADFQTAPCWIVVTPDGKFAYVVNTASGVISGYQVGSNGVLSLLGSGVTAQTPPGPLDDAFLDGDLFDVTSGGSIIGFQVQADGALTSLDLSATVPAGSRGLVAIAVPEPSTWARCSSASSASPPSGRVRSARPRRQADPALTAPPPARGVGRRSAPRRG
jgi:hypothetical protein